MSAGWAPAGFTLHGRWRSEGSLVAMKEGGPSMANQIGKIYVCSQCGAQVIVTKGGAGTIKCCGSDMQQKK